MKRKPVMAANWKMNKTHIEAQLFVEELRNRLKPDAPDKVDIVICPPFTSIRTVQTTIDGDDLGFGVGAQNMHWEDAGAYTGEVSAAMLAKLGVKYVVLGHSERREYFDETDEMVNKKVQAAIEAGLTPILCVGETLEERESGVTEEKLARQITAGLKGVKPEQMKTMIVAYEPIWAIGTGKTASPSDAESSIAFIRGCCASISAEAAEAVRIQYGGSVKPDNIAELMAEPNIDGALVGGASLDAADFARIVDFA